MCFILFALLVTTAHRAYGDHEQLIRNIVAESSDQVNLAISSTHRQMDKALQTPNTRLLFAKLRMPSLHGAQDATASAEVLEMSRENLQQSVSLSSVTSLQMQAMMTQAGCKSSAYTCPHTEFNARCRTMDGSCNNMDHSTWGSRMTPLERMIPARYEDGYNDPVGWNIGQLHNGFEIPSAREVTNLVMSSPSTTDDTLYTDLLTQWGQFHDHDVDLTPLSPSNARFDNGVSCDVTCENSAPCFPIPFPDDDPRNISAECLPFTRSATTCSINTRDQVNVITSYIDASMVYGSSDNEQQMLREFFPNVGNMRTGDLSPYGKPYLPFDTHFDPNGCIQDPMATFVPCFVAGDRRMNEQIGLTTLHTIFMREHNRIAAELRALNPGLDGDTIFYETRNIMGAMMQTITYDDYLPKILGPAGMAGIDTYIDYDPLVEGAVFNAFAAAAFRFGHGTVHSLIFRVDEMLNPIAQGHLALHLGFFSPYRIIDEGGFDPILRGMFAFPAKQVLHNEVLNEELTELLFALANTVASDLASVNIQRGRDHGLPSYNTYREECGLPRALTFDDLAADIPDQATRDNLEALYGHVDNMDLFVGGMIEEKVAGARVGPVFSCILVRQYIKLRDGDRFWYENPTYFSPEQITEIRKASISRVICDNSENIQEVPVDAFVNTPLQDFVSCDDIPSIDLSPWAGLKSIAGDCATCKFGADNVGFLPHLNCRFYYRCQRLADGSFYRHEMCCPGGTFWDQSQLTCSSYNQGTAKVCPDYYQCPEQQIIDGECLLLPGPADNLYIEMVGSQQNIRPCPAGTVYREELCTCDFPVPDEGPVDTCDSDPLLWFKFNGDYNDCQCPKAVGIVSGDTRLSLNDPSSPDCDGMSNCAACFYGDGGFIEFGYLKNWFAGKPHREFSISVWIYQTAEGFANVVEGIFSNGLCKDEPSLWLAVGSGIAVGGINQDVFTTVNGSPANRAYSAEVWTHLGITFSRTHTEYYMDGVKVDTRLHANGQVQNTQVGSTIGLVHFECIPHFFHGCVDDLRFFDRYLDDAEMSGIFSGGRM